MPNPTLSDVHVNGPLTNVSIAYALNADRFIAPQVFPNVPVAKQSDAYYTYARDDWFRADAQLRAPGTESVGGGYRIGQDTYFAHVYAFHKDIDDQIRANADPGISMDRDASRYVTNNLLLRREKLFVSTFFGTGIWGRDVTGVAGAPAANQFQQFDQAASKPIEVLRAEILAMSELTGYEPNTLVMGPRVWNALADHASFLERIKYTERGVVGTDLLASLLGIERVLIPRGIEVTTAEEAAVDTYAFLFGKSMWLGYVAPSPGLMQPSAGYTFSWTGFLGAGAMGLRMKTFRMEHLESDRVEGEMAFDMKVVAPELGTFFSTAVA